MGLLTAETREQIRREVGTDRRHADRGQWRFPVAVVAVGVVAMAVLVGGLAAREPQSDLLLVRMEDGAIALLDQATGASRYELADAVPTPDRSALLTTRPNGGETVLETRDPSTGSVTGSTNLTGDLVVRTVSPRGTAVGLMPHRPGADLYQPQSRETTELTVAFIDERPPLRFTLDGNIEPEMFSVDDATLFVLEFVPPSDPTGYYVKKLDLATGTLTDTAGHEVDINPAMRGKARAQAMHPDGTFLYTLYTLPAGAPVHDDLATSDSERWAFVHVISLEEGWSHCVFLPVPFGAIDEAALGLSVAPDGDTVIVADPSSSLIAELDTASNTIRGVHHVEALRPGQRAAVVAVGDDDRTYVAVDSTILELAPRTFQVAYAWSQSLPVTHQSVDGGQLRIGGGGEIALIDRATRQETGVISSPDRGTLELLGPPRGSVTEFPLECAC
jgi:hypothetical protein